MMMHHATSSRPRGPRVRHPHPLRTDRARRALALGATTSGRYASRSRKPDAELLSWAKSKGAQPMDVFSLREDEETGMRGVYTKRALEADSIVCEVPRKLALEVTTAKTKCPVDGLDQEFWNKCDWWGKLACLLLAELQKGDSSPLKAYLDALPEAIPTPLHWTPEQLEMLQYRPLVDEVDKQREVWHGLYDRYCSASSARPLPTREAFVHAIECVRSRTFSGPYEGSNWETRIKQYGLVLVLAVGYVLGGFGEAYQAFNGALVVFLTILFRDLLVQRNPRSIRYVLCPVLDMFNHRSDVESDPSYEYFRNTFTLTLSKPVAENQEVCINYGKRGNDELMQYYGFVVPDNRHDSYTLSGFLDKAADVMRAEFSQEGGEGLAAKRLEMLSGTDTDVVVVRPKRLGLTGRALQALRVLVSTEEELRGRAALLDFGTKVSDANEALALRLMRRVCERELEEVLPTTKEEDEKALANLSGMGQDLSQVEVKMQALRFRIQKKRVLETYIESQV